MRINPSVKLIITSLYCYVNYIKILVIIFLKLLPLLIVSLFLTFLLIKAKMSKLFYLLIVVEVIGIFVMHYSTISMSMMLYEQTKAFSTLSNMFIIVGMYLLIPLLSIILYIILRKRI